MKIWRGVSGVRVPWSISALISRPGGEFPSRLLVFSNFFTSQKLALVSSGMFKV